MWADGFESVHALASAGEPFAFGYGDDTTVRGCRAHPGGTTEGPVPGSGGIPTPACLPSAPFAALP